ncbi:putative polyubiquitin binding protein [Myriangium duriaei CBS 260.36]|uniref:Polyubiquitin binding protein n=1 Tax=Myriangium duriaei CBS 260.36 TaxID=1168546 RepID=A0A9P4MGC2_9PEZI|nr:putative polyubiquitin binding protein [Myriangium duriaei CBS 260.36]
MAEFKLAATLKGHEDDVRAVVFPSSKTLLSASRDGTVRYWTLTSPKPLHYDDTIAAQSSSFVNSLAFVPPSSHYTNGLIASAGKDTVIDVRQPGSAPDQNAERLLLGHAHNVCTLDAASDGRHLVSGGWDKQARVWDIDRGETVAELKGHDASVWAVLVYDDNHILTGCADQHIRIFHPKGKLLQDIAGLPDVVRALCKLPSNHSSGAAFASAGNDQIIRLWTLDGLEIGQLHGHEAFIYSLGVLPNGDIVSSSEDRTVRVWRDGACIQTITHPAISVWTVAVCPETGDIATGASDRLVRVFSRDPERQADFETLQAFTESVKASSIPQQTTGDGQNINKENLPGPDFLKNKSGTKEGQVQMIREDNGNITAHTWSTAAQQWINVGTVVDSAGSSGRKVTHNGQDYDYVFDVDIEDGKPPLKLPFNTSQNPYEAAQKFIADNELPITYLDQVANFILQNTQGANIGNSSASQGRTPGTDPWGTENRYRPGEAGAPPPREDTRPRSLPQTQYLSITTANLPAIRKKVAELNGSEDSAARLSTDELTSLESLTKQIQSSPRDPKPQSVQIDTILKIATTWSPASRLPGLDILRLCAISPSFAASTSAGNTTIVDTLEKAEAFSQQAERPNNTMMAIRVLVNMFDSKEGRLIVDGASEQILTLIEPFTLSTNKNLSAAIATILINFAVLSTTSAPSQESTFREVRGTKLATLAQNLLQSSTDSETTYRGLVAFGTLLSLGEDFRKQTAKVNEVNTLLSKVSGGPFGKENRVKHLVEEIKDLLR